MSLLLDTCVFLWLIGFPERLPTTVRSVLEAGETSVWVSVATLWEVLIKHGKGQVGLDTDRDSALHFLLKQCQIHLLAVLSIDPASLDPLQRLPDIHRDPFDRLLICQAIEHGLTLVTPDLLIQRYPIKTLWA